MRSILLTVEAVFVDNQVFDIMETNGEQLGCLCPCASSSNAHPGAGFIQSGDRVRAGLTEASVDDPEHVLQSGREALALKAPALRGGGNLAFAISESSVSRRFHADIANG